jgi:putative two-component system response regulator
MKSASQIALTHHERWDGGGYPNRLQGENIPIEGRVVALCDVFDALISRRPYKEKWPVGQAVMQIESESGGAFDPYLVAKFHEALMEIQEIFRQLELKIPPGLRYQF